ncbi:MAG TPA: hypothetical protein K8U81_01395 [Phocaeicola coprocola]|uniref:Uncharacterized protein n=1 Tax=Phocaeicola coprocola TaxID=310298 RepID=A0A921K265_9BACT|nr:hypothetical protein [Phocaeicola coprocola]
MTELPATKKYPGASVLLHNGILRLCMSYYEDTLQAGVSRIIKYSISTCLWRISTVCTAFMHKDLENMQKHHTFAPSKTKLTNEYKSDTYRHKVAVA